MESPSNPLKVLVTGATGKQGGAVARALLAAGHRVRALTRDPGAPAAVALAAAGAEVVQGDFEQPDALRRAIDGVDSVFAMSAFWETGVEGEVRQGVALVEAAHAVGVGHLVYTSVAGADARTGIPHFDSKHQVEQALTASGVPWTVLAPVYFMENLFMPQTVEGLKAGVYAQPLPPRRLLQQVAVADIGRMGFVALTERLVGRRIELASDEIDGEATARALSRALGRPIRYQPVPLEAIEAQSHEMAVMYRYFDEVGYKAGIPDLRREFPQIGWHRFDDWLAAQDLATAIR